MKTCKRCSKDAEFYVLCFICNAVYHPKCLLTLPGNYVNKKGHMFCCSNVTSKTEENVGNKAVEEKKKSTDCRIDLNERNELRGLQSSELQINKLFKCNICNYSTNWPGGLKNHSVFHSTERKFKCGTCGKLFKRKTTLKVHVELHMDNRQRFSCSYCNANFHRKYYLNLHIKLEHSNYEKYHCEICDFVTDFKSNFNKHQLKHDKNGKQQYHCAQCNFSTVYKGSLLKHVHLHTQEKPYKCTYNCGYVAAEKSNVTRHILVKHKGTNKKFKCSYKDCSYEASTKSNLNRHILVIHNTDEEKTKYKCNECNFSTFIKDVLNAHIRHVHSNEKPYKCNYKDCSFESSWRNSLNMHVNRVHLHLKPFVCDLCEGSFSTSAHLNRHVNKKRNCQNM